MSESPKTSDTAYKLSLTADNAEWKQNAARKMEECRREIDRLTAERDGLAKWKRQQIESIKMIRDIAEDHKIDGGINAMTAICAKCEKTLASVKGGDA